MPRSDMCPIKSLPSGGVYRQCFDLSDHVLSLLALRDVPIPSKGRQYAVVAKTIGAPSTEQTGRNVDSSLGHMLELAWPALNI